MQKDYVLSSRSRLQEKIPRAAAAPRQAGSENLVLSRSICEYRLSLLPNAHAEYDLLNITFPVPRNLALHTFCLEKSWKSSDEIFF